MNAEDEEENPSDNADTDPTSLYSSDSPDVESFREARLAAIDNFDYIGSRWRWYDIPYRLMFWLASGARRRLVPGAVRRSLINGMNFLIPFNEIERLRSLPAQDPMYSLVLPSEERIKVAGLWVVELFPPSQSINLLKSLERNGWGKAGPFPSSRGTHRERVEGARRSGSRSWTHLGAVQDVTSKMMVLDAKKERLPEPFSVVSLTSFQIGGSLTAVVAFFRFKERDGWSSIDDARRAANEPVLVWHGAKHPNALNRGQAAQRAMQNERRRIHDMARDWMSEKIPGHFASTELRQPVLDLVLFDLLDPRTTTGSFAAQGALDGLGVDAWPTRYSSPEVPGVCFLPAEAISGSPPLANSWLASARYATLEAATDSDGYGDRPLSPRTLAYRYDVEMQSLLVRLGIRRYVEQARETYSELFDLAHAKHSRFKPRENDRLARQLLGSSLDLPLLAQDINQTWNFWPGEISLRGETAGREWGDNEWNALQVWGQDLTKSLKELISMDGTYRDVLSTATSLTGASQNARITRWALLVALVSLIVAIATLAAAGM